MKTTLRIPMSDPYAYIELESTQEESFDDVYQKYQSIMRLVKGGDGLSDKEFNGILDHYLSGKPFIGDDIMVQLERMNQEQRNIMSAIKRSKARTK